MHLAAIGACAALLVAGFLCLRAREERPRRLPSDLSSSETPTTELRAPQFPETDGAPTDWARALRLTLEDLPDGRRGCRVAYRDGVSAGRPTGLEPGDVIVGVGGEPLTPRIALDLVNRLSAAGEAGLALTLLRDGSERDVAVRLAR